MINLASLSGSAKTALGLGAALLLAVSLGAAVWWGYDWGYGVAEAKGQAALAAYQAQVAEAERLAADLARRVLDAEIVRRDGLARDLQKTLKTLAAQRRELTKRRIAHAARDVSVADGAVVLGPDWLCLYNAALGLGDGRCLSASAPGAGAGPGGAGAPDPGVLRTGRGVTPADVLAHARDVGGYMKELRARYLALIAWAEGLPQSRSAAGGAR